MTKPSEHAAQELPLSPAALASFAHEPIHRSGAVQPVGVLLAIDSYGVIQGASDGAFGLLGVSARELVGRKLSEFVEARQVLELLAFTGGDAWRPSAITTLDLLTPLGRISRDCHVSRSGELWLVEIELAELASHDSCAKLFLPIRDALWKVDSETDMARYAEAVCAQMRILTGYGRVLMCKFNADWDGEVLAESREEHMPSLRGEHFPAFGIPTLVRELYSRNMVQAVGDTSCAPDGIAVANGLADAYSLDLTFSAFRAMAPVYVTYLTHLGVAASVTIALLQNGRLWGLVVCHNDTPKYLPLRTRELYEFIAKTVSLKLGNLAQEPGAEVDPQYRCVAEHSTDVTASLSPTGEVIQAAGPIEAVLGIPEAQLIGRRLSDVLDQGYADAFFDAWVRAKEKPTQVVLRMTHETGQVWVEFDLSLCDADGRLELRARDVTQRHNYQLALDDLHRRNSATRKDSAEGLLSTNNRGVILYANERAHELLHYTTKSLVGVPVAEILADGGEFVSATRPLRAKLLGAQSSVVLVEYVATPLADGGRVVVLHAVQDRTQMDMSAAAIASTQESIVVTDTQGRIVSVNKAFERITGYSAAEAVGNTPRLLRSGAHSQTFYDNMWRDIHSRGVWTGEIWNRRKNGEVYPQRGSIMSVSDATGKARNYVAIFTDVSQAKQVEESLYFLQNHDSLTALPNRASFTEQLDAAVRQASRTKELLGVAMIGVDRIKLVNDTFGHAIGDDYLRAVAGRISEACRPADVVARWGGDEFILMARELDSVLQLEEQVRNVLAHVADDLLIQDSVLRPSVSVGVSVYPTDGLAACDLIRSADTVMHRVKDNGRNNYGFYSAELASDARRKLEVASELQRAVTHNELRLHYQPQIDSRTGQLVGLEALVRWQHPERGLVFPGYFIPVAEELGLVNLVGSWVLREACRQMAEWRAQGVACPHVSVNVAPTQLKGAFIAEVQQALTQHAVPAELLTLEITESALSDFELAREVLTGLRQLGVSLSIDDFGTGYSSLSHLKHFPVSCFKIDKSFVDGAPHLAADVAIIKTIAALSEALGLSVVAEGVESQEQLEFLRSINVCCIQGYVYSKPIPPEAIVDRYFRVPQLIEGAV